MTSHPLAPPACPKVAFGQSPDGKECAITSLKDFGSYVVAGWANCRGRWGRSHSVVRQNGMPLVTVSRLRSRSDLNQTVYGIKS